MGLSEDDVRVVREGVAAGRKPKVVFTESAGQIAGQTGHVVHLDDPELQEDWIQVRFGSDVLPFPPSDLSVAPRGAVGRKVSPAEVPAPAPPELKIVREKVPAARVENKPSAPVIQEKTVSEEDNPAMAPAPRKPAAAKAPGSAKGTKPLPSFTVTLSYTEGDWTVGAVQGSKTLAKPYVIKPSEALKMVSMIDVPGVHEAVEHILGAERAQAKAQAEKLRSELAELESKLAELGA